MNQDPWTRQKKLHSPPTTKVAEAPKRKWRILPILWLAFKRTSMLLGAVILIGSFVMVWTLAPYVEDIDESLPDEMVLYMEFDGSMGDLPASGGFVDPFLEDKKTVKNYIDALERAKTDPRVKGIYARLKNMQMSVAHVQEVRQAILNFRESGKFAYIYASSYEGGLGSYYLATAFEEIWMQPMGVLVIPGIGAEMPFIRGMLDKIGIEPQIVKRKEYKDAYDMITETGMSDKSREALRILIDDIASVLKADIALHRDMTQASVKDAVDKGVFLSDEALSAKLIDKADYADVLVGQINKQVTGQERNDSLAYVRFKSYITDMKQQKKFATKKKKDGSVALVYAVGAIMDSDREGNAIDDGVAGADEIAKALIDAAYDNSIDAVVLRVDSPGGSPVASETILRAVQKVKDEGKVVIVSMGSAAASGGYWIATLADKIYVLPTTLTGSIGVLGGKVSMAGLWQMLGINWDEVSWGKNATIWSMSKPFSESEKERVNAMMDNIYSNFVKRVAKGRNMTEEEVEKIARGRVWSGKSALEIGLADEFGGLNEALDYAAVQTGAMDRHDVNVVVMPKPLSAIERFLELIETQATTADTLQMQSEIMKEFMPAVQDMMMMKKLPNGAVYEPVKLH